MRLLDRWYGIAILAELIAFTAAIALRSMQVPGPDRPPDRRSGQVISHTDLRSDAPSPDCPNSSAGRRTPIEQATPTSPWQPTSARKWGVHLIKNADRARRQEMAHRDFRRHLFDKPIVIGQHRRDNAAGAVSRRGHDSPTRRVLSPTAMANI